MSFTIPIFIDSNKYRSLHQFRALLSKENVTHAHHEDIYVKLRDQSIMAPDNLKSLTVIEMTDTGLIATIYTGRNMLYYDIKIQPWINVFIKFDGNYYYFRDTPARAISDIIRIAYNKRNKSKKKQEPEPEDDHDE